MNGLTLKKADPDDLPIVLALLKEAAQWLQSKGVDYWQNWHNPPPNHVRWIFTGLKNSEFYFVVENDQVIGTFRLQDHDETFWGSRTEKAGYVHSFTIKRSHQGRGHGYAVLTMIGQILASEGIYNIRLDCGANVQGLRNYYERYGFVQRGHVVVHGETLVLYEKQVT